MLSEISQTQKDKYYMISYMEPNRAKLIKEESRIIVAKGWGE